MRLGKIVLENLKLARMNATKLLKKSTAETCDKSCIPGNFVGHYRVADVPGQALSGIRVDNFQQSSLTGKNFAQAQR